MIGAEGVRPPAGLAGRPVAALSPSGSNNPHRIKGKITFFSMRNICLSGLNGALPLFIQAQPRRLTARPAESLACSDYGYEISLTERKVKVKVKKAA
ncbi:hypothetical protein BSG1_16845 [Bacillus sp. SG-1]|nr:hypothetical protein BSG1_16845 [Bacillus sp. SG-1]